MDFQKEIARALLEIGAVGFKPKEPLTFKSGLISPVYVDNRIFPSYPEKFQVVIEGFENLVKEKKIDFDMVAGIAVGGIPYSAVLGFKMQKPSIFIRKEAKGHGKGKRVEGGEVKGKKILLVEDLVSTGGSSLSGVEALREEGATVDDCLVIVSYEFKEAKENFEKAKVNLHTLTSFPVIFQQAVEMKIIIEDVKKIVEDWLSDPWDWAGKYGFGK
ncbi:MAG: Orotate phosphoribosyltransferase [Candidatus Moranbacteria bacterium GW2011_GWC1_45_18]|nr:MAG: Orotate phosphoribosyltransferase [Candidatus Moranbacteria bacterium GW2011_GWC2_40_12]KKT33814.1 MAG: Orotate phosphoribosyltransferase [Candidatus Moranbacteria bacterium GW2011_GWF2_44_10]KKU00912.1 MAG: Orotate phosphoribosyltransferase [Candidatus Moranbacteria bacterium GW2011_GWC1_45_18]OGI34727.1 MAG: orotate phosphoribosyltransferase [Candidatus Moranbacteria bacterium RIFOXYC1_FULL_44_8]OGI40346.1 MAG: orotate phosphoribosyltransferase [Candidatus Moranbacteria bacterium RIFO